MDHDQWLDQVGADRSDLPEVVRLAPTITGVWENYKLYLKRGVNLSAYHRHVPTFFTFDDHEILNDVWGAGSPGLRDRRAVFRDIGVRAWYRPDSSAARALVPKVAACRTSAATWKIRS